MSKGSSPRPFSVTQDEYAKNFDAIFGKKNQKEQYIPPTLEEQTKKFDIKWTNLDVDSPIKDK